MSEEIRKAIQEGQTVLGLEFGSTRIKAVLVDGSHQPRSEEHTSELQSQR